MAIYSIKDLEQLSGIKAHTIRVWEQRYGLIEPRRTATNIRYYDDEDLKFLLNIALLNKNGLKISKISKMSREEITKRVRSFNEIDDSFEGQLDALTLSMIDMDEAKFLKIIDNKVRILGFERTMLDVILPFLEKLGVLWLTGSIHPVQENFITCLIRQKLIVAIDQLGYQFKSSKEKFILYLHEGEKQELTMLFMNYLLKARGIQVVYVGQDISLYDLKDVCHIHKPTHIYTIISETFARQPLQTYVNDLSNAFPYAEIVLSGYQVAAQGIASEKNIQVIYSLEETIAYLIGLQAANADRISSK